MWFLTVSADSFICIDLIFVHFDTFSCKLYINDLSSLCYIDPKYRASGANSFVIHAKHCTYKFRSSGSHQNLFNIYSLTACVDTLFLKLVKCTTIRGRKYTTALRKPWSGTQRWRTKVKGYRGSSRFKWLSIITGTYAI